MSSTLDFEITRNERPASAAERARVLADPGFGRHFTSLVSCTMPIFMAPTLCG